MSLSTHDGPTSVREHGDCECTQPTDDGYLAMTVSRTRRLLTIYVIAVLCLTLAGSALTESAEDASIGGALLLGVVALLGLPWSAAVFLADDGLQGGAVSAAIYALLAILNALLVLSFMRAVDRRRTT